jgi:CBS domain-containing protein
MSKSEAPPVSGDVVAGALADAAVGDVMTPGIVSCHQDATIGEVARIMATHRVHCVAIMNLARDESGELMVWGIISDRDVIRGAIESGTYEDAGRVAEQPVITVRPELSLRDAGEVMFTNRISHLVVIDPQTALPIGILSSLDIVRAIT